MSERSTSGSFPTPPTTQSTTSTTGLSPELLWARLQRGTAADICLAPYNLVTSSDTVATEGVTLADLDLSTEHARRSMRIFPLRPRPESHFDFVTVGRNPNNDVVINDGTISYFHAYFPDPDAATVVDAGSTNGTFINGLRVDVKGSGKTTAFDDGDRIRLGNIRGTLLSRTQTVALIEQLVGADQPFL